jgi:hypothetical protein
MRRSGLEMAELQGESEVSWLVWPAFGRLAS